MAPNTHPSREATASADTQAALVELLVAHVDRAFVTAGQPGVLTAVRDMFLRMEPGALTAVAYQLGLEVEPGREAEAEDRRPEQASP